VAGGERIAYAAHIGGIAFAWLYMRTPPAASIERLRQRISPAPDYPQDETPRAIPRTLPRARTQRDEVDEIVANRLLVLGRCKASVVAFRRRAVDFTDGSQTAG